MKKHSVIEVDHITKYYHLYASNFARLKAALSPFKSNDYKKFNALDDVSFQINSGESVGIIGMNGSGKSTLLKIIAGVTTPNLGSVKIQGRLSTLLELGSGFNPEFTGMENIYFQTSLQGLTYQETKSQINKILDFAEIGEFIHQPVKTYSSGMYVRLAFSVAIMVDPDILIVDEALSVGDAYFQAKCVSRMKEYLEKNKTLLFVSHDPSAVKSLCNRAILLNQGIIEEDGKPDKVFDYYNSLIAEKSFNKEKKSKLHIRSGNKKIEIANVEILNPKGQSTEIFITGESVTIAIHLQCHEKVENPTIGILIRDIMGHDIFGINNAHMNLAIGTLIPGSKLTVYYKVPLNLGPNTYSLTVATHSSYSHVEENFDWINNIIVFQVVPNTEPKFLGYCKLTPSFSFEYQE